MEKYESLLNEVNEFLLEEEIDGESTNNQIISMYDLYMAIKHELNGLKEILNITSLLENKLSTFLYYHLFGSLKNDKFYSAEKVDVKLYSDSEKSGITFKTETNEVSVNKDKNVEGIYISDELSKENKSIFKFIKKNYCLILDIIYQLEEYSNLVGGISSENKIKDMDFSDNLFNVNITYSNLGEVDVTVGVNQDHPHHLEYYKNWYTKVGIYKIVNEKKEEILKRIPVSVNEIDKEFLDIYNKNIEKQHIKSIKWWN